MHQALATPAAGATLDPATVRDTIASVFTQPAYDVSLRQSVGDRIVEWIIRTLAGIANALRGSADLRWLVIGAALLIVTVVLARAAFLSAASARRGALRRAAPRAKGADAWTAAAAEATAGRYLEAAHLLYAAVLDALAVQHRVALHPAKTAGEYEHELLARAPRAIPAFTAFIRAYERAIWGKRVCDQQEYERLRELAVTMALAEPERVAA